MKAGKKVLAAIGICALLALSTSMAYADDTCDDAEIIAAGGGADTTSTNSKYPYYKRGTITVKCCTTGTQETKVLHPATYMDGMLASALSALADDKKVMFDSYDANNTYLVKLLVTSTPTNGCAQ